MAVTHFLNSLMEVWISSIISALYMSNGQIQTTLVLESFREINLAPVLMYSNRTIVFL